MNNLILINGMETRFVRFTDFSSDLLSLLGHFDLSHFQMAINSVIWPEKNGNVRTNSALPFFFTKKLSD